MNISKRSVLSIVAFLLAFVLWKHLVVLQLRDDNMRPLALAGTYLMAGPLVCLFVNIFMKIKKFKEEGLVWVLITGLPWVIFLSLVTGLIVGACSWFCHGSDAAIGYSFTALILALLGLPVALIIAGLSRELG